MKNRHIYNRIIKRLSHRHGRVIVISGARQTGKSTLCHQLLDRFSYISMDDPVMREEYLRLTANDWAAQYPYAIIDEVQKAPQLFDTIKAVHDRGGDTRYILTGSAQILLLNSVRESLAGRCTSFQLYPLTLPEFRTSGWDDNIELSLFQRWLTTLNASLFNERPLLSESFTHKKIALRHYLRFGAMPEMSHADLEEDDKDQWLYEYYQTYLQRDIRDIANIKDLTSFINAQKYLAANTGQLLNFSTVAKMAGITSVTAKKFVSYLEISCQTITLPPWFKNENKKLAKSPKVHFLDPGVQRAILRRKGELTGNEYESAVVAEIVKQVQNIGFPADFYHLRTLDNREVDLVLELDEGYVLFEIKKSIKVNSTDARHLKNIDEIFDKPILGSFVLSEDPRIEDLGNNIKSIPTAWFLG